MAERVVCKECGRKFDTADAMKQHYAAIHERKEEVHEVHNKKKTSTSRVIMYAVIVLIIAGLGYLVYGLIFQPGTIVENVGPVGSEHTHIDFKMYMQGFNNDQPIDFTQSKYQLRSSFVHFENGDGNVIHKHATGVTLGFAMKTLRISLTDNCLTLDTGQQFCNSGDKALKVYVNNKTIDNPAGYNMKDLDKILVTYGNWSSQQIHDQLNSITNEAPAISAKGGAA